MLGNRAAPTFNALRAALRERSTRYYGVTHPSLPNYLALVSGSTQGITSRLHRPASSAAQNLADTLEAAGQDLEDLRGGTAARRASSAPYSGATRRSTIRSPTSATSPGIRQRRARIVPLTRLARGPPRRRPADFSLVVPDLCHSMHDCSVAVGDAWLRAHRRPAACGCRGTRRLRPVRRGQHCAARRRPHRRRWRSAPPSGRARLSRA